jgi:hypothetical protein
MNVLQAYNILSQRQTNEDRIVAERLLIGCLCNSIMLVAFFTATQTNYFVWMSIALPLFGIIFSCGLVFVLYVSSKAMIGWYNALYELEQKPDFAYMKDEGVRPLTDISGMTLRHTHIWKLGFYVAPFFPLPFIIIWICLIFI